MSVIVATNMNHSNINTVINSISTEEYSIKTKRPKYSLLDNSKIINSFDIKQMNYLDSLRKCIKILQNES